MKMTKEHQTWLRACIEKHGIFEYKTALNKILYAEG